MEKLVLIDGHSILNRAFYGVPDLSNSAGLHTNAVYGFLNILFKILEEEQPDYLAVAFDVHAPTFRHEIYQAYKGTRKPMPEELREQVPVMKEVLSAMGICLVEKAGYEADDILGTLAKRAEKDGMEVSLVSGDRDLLQIATDHIKIRIPKTKGGKTEIEDYYAEDVEKRYQVTPEQFIDLKALMGDTADNIPGVPKVGEKTATELLLQFSSLQNLYEHVEEVTKKAVRESLIQNKELADLSKVLATINVDSPIELDFEKARVKDFYTEDAYVLFKKLEFKNLLSRFEKGVSNEKITAAFRRIDGEAEGKAFMKRLSETEEEIGFALIKKEKEELLGASFSVAGRETVFIDCRKELSEKWLLDQLQLLAEEHRLACANIKEAYFALKSEATERFFDIILGAYLLNPLKNDYTTEDVANEQLGLMIPEYHQVFGKLSVNDALMQKEREFTEYACFLAYVCAAAAPVLREKLAEQGMDRLMEEIEMPLTYVLYDMEKEGVLVKPDELKAYGEALCGDEGSNAPLKAAEFNLIDDEIVVWEDSQTLPKKEEKEKSSSGDSQSSSQSPGGNMQISSYYINLMPGEETAIELDYPNGYGADDFKWSTSDKNVVTVKNGKLVAKKSGSAIVKAESKDGKYYANCAVYVGENKKEQ